MSENDDFMPPADPFGLFADWFALAEKGEPNDPNAMTLATVGTDGMPSARVILMKSFDEKGFTFFTNRQSRKGEQLGARPMGALCWHWKSLRRQVRAEGEVHRLGDAGSDAYFAMRPRGSQIGAWASQQSRPLESRAVLEQAVREIEEKYEGKSVPRPPHWGGYILVPRAIEFWQERKFRLHDRIVYKRMAAEWTHERLFP